MHDIPAPGFLIPVASLTMAGHFLRKRRIQK